MQCALCEKKEFCVIIENNPSVEDCPILICHDCFLEEFPDGKIQFVMESRRCKSGSPFSD